MNKAEIPTAVAARFEQFIERIPIAGCWIWTGAVRKGYGEIALRPGFPISAHRLAVILYRGEVPDDAMVCHRCDVRECVNPEHLYIGNATTNRRDAIDRGRWSHPYSNNETCAKGHRYDSGRGYRIAADGSRVCRECMRQHMANFRKRKPK